MNSFLKIIAVLLATSSFISQVITLGPEELVISSGGSAYYLDGYTAHEGLAQAIGNYLNERILGAVQFALTSSGKNPDDVLTAIDSKQYLIIHIFHALSSNDSTYMNLLFQISNQLLSNDESISTDWLSIVKYSQSQIYDIIKILTKNGVHKLNFPSVLKRTVVHVCQKYDILEHASSVGDSETVEWLLSQGYAPKKDGLNALILAWNNSHWPVVKQLVERGLSPRSMLSSEQARMKNDLNETLLHFAAEVNRVDVAGQLLSKGADLNAVDKNGHTPLHRAIMNNSYEVLLQLLGEKPNIKYRTRSGDTFLHYAVLTANVDIIKLIVINGVSVNSENNDGKTALQVLEDISIVPFLKTAENNNFPTDLFNSHINSTDCSLNCESSFSFLNLNKFGLNSSQNLTLTNISFAFKYLQSKGAKLNGYNCLKKSLLLSSIKVGYVEGLKFLMEMGTNPNLVIDDNRTLLHEASQKGSEEAVEVLYWHKANIRALTSEGLTALHLAAIEGKTDVLRLLIYRDLYFDVKDKNGITPLYYAACMGHVNVTKYLLGRGANANIKTTTTQSTPLHCAAWRGHLAVARVLLGMGARVDEIDKLKWTPLIEASRKGQTEIVQLLLEHKANARAENNLGETPLHIAAAEGHLPVVKALVSWGVGVEFMDREGYTPLYYAVLKGHSDVADFLISKGANVNAKNKDGWAPLHWAANGGFEDAVRLLLDKGADVDIVNQFRVTPLQEAARYGHYEIVQLLIKRGADPKIASLSTGDTAEDVAFKNDHEDIVQYLRSIR